MTVPSEPVPTVTVIPVRACDLRDLMVVRRRGTSEPWRSVYGVIPGDAGDGMDGVIIAGGGDPKGVETGDQYARWPFERAEHHAFPRSPLDRHYTDNQFHWDDVALIFSVPDRQTAAPDARDHELLICGRWDLFDVQVLTPAPITLVQGEFQTVQE